MIKVDDIAKETLYVLNYFDSNFISKIPNKFLENLKDIAEKSQITVKIDRYKKLEEQEISEDCKDLIALIYYNYVANEKDKEEILKYWKKNEKKYQDELNEKYNANDIFKNIHNNAETHTNTTEKSEQSNLPQIVENHSFIKSIWKKIKELFNKNNNAKN